MTADDRRRANPRGQGSRLRAELLDAAARLLDGGGRDVTITLRGVAREAGVAAPSIYDHFPRLDDLLLALAEEFLAELSQVLDQAARRVRAPDPEARLRAVARAYLRWGMGRPGPYALVFEGRGLPAVNGSSPGDRLPSVPLDVLTDVLAGVLTDGDPASANPRLAALTVWTGLHGIVTLRAARPDVSWPAVNRHLDAVLGGVRPG